MSVAVAELHRDEALQRVRERICRFAASRVSKEAAEDLAQEVLLLLATKYAHLREPEDLVPLAFRIVRFKMMALRRKVVRRGETSMVAEDDRPVDFADPTVFNSPEDQLRRRELADRLAVALPQLPDRCRRLFRLKLEGYRFAAIRETMGAASVNTVYTWDLRCRERLLALMGGSWEL